jgi:hypothetical protein
MKTRLDPLEKIRKRAELVARATLSTANGKLASAKEALQNAAEEVASAPLPAGSAWLVDSLDVAQTVSVEKLKTCRTAVDKAADVAAAAGVAQVSARQAARLITRVIEERRAVMVKERDRKEQKILDEIAQRE